MDPTYFPFYLNPIYTEEGRITEETVTCEVTLDDQETMVHVDVEVEIQYGRVINATWHPVDGALYAHDMIMEQLRKRWPKTEFTPS